MEIYRRGNTYSTVFSSDKGERMLDVFFSRGEFLFSFHTDEVIINKNDDKDLYRAFSNILDEKYLFAEERSHQDRDRIVWFSDFAEMYNSDSIRDRYPSLVIDRFGDDIVLSYWKDTKYRKKDNNQPEVIAISPMLGAWSKNINKDTSFQEDIIREYCKAYKREKTIDYIKQRIKTRFN